MGLDMYLYVRKQTYRSDLEKEGTALEYPTELKELGDDICKGGFKSITTTTDYKVGYWRKFNALHSYIVRTFADGEDRCQTIYLDKERVEKMISILEAISKDHSLAAGLMPCQRGFFFGPQDYDEWYFRNVDYSLTTFKKVLPLYDSCSDESDTYIIYEASW